ncbi:MAG TPA: TonB family protein [Candidatus Aminicenantes bacterium]|nr:TonB family protein [Candidatus Aminicenantes bacterium]
MMQKKVLIVDYDMKDTTRVSELLTNYGFEVAIAGDGQAGWDQYSALKPDVVLLEPMLSKIHGFELCQRIRSDSLGRTQVIIVTGTYKDPIYKTETLRTYGIFRYFVKPVDNDKLLAAVNGAFNVGKEHEPGQPEFIPPVAASSKPPEEKLRPVAEKKEFDFEQPEFIPPVPASFKPPAEKPRPVAEKKEPESKQPEFIPPVPASSKPSLEKLRPAAEKPKQRTPDAGNVEVDALLKKALKGFDLETGLIKSPGKEPKKAPAPEPPRRPVPAPETRKTEPIAPKKEERPPKPEPPAAPPPRTESSVHTERTPFGDLYEEPAKKNFKPVVIIAAVVVLAVAAFLILKPGSPGATNEVQAGGSSLLEPAADLETGSMLDSETVAIGSEIQETDPENAVKPEPAKPVDKIETARPRPSEQPAAPPAAQAKPVARRPESAPEAVRSVEPEATKVQRPAETVGDKRESTPAPAASTPAEKPVQESAPPPEVKESVPPAAAQAVTPPPAEVKQPPAVKPSPPSVQRGQLVPLNEVSQKPSVVRRVMPVYPEIARRLKIEGSVTVNALIDESGNVIDTEVIKGIKNDSGTHRAAEAAVRKWRFNPALVNGVPVKVWMPVALVFKVE